MNLFQRTRIKYLSKKAMRYYENREFEKAIEIYKEIRRIDYRLAWAISGIATCKYELHEYEEAIQFVNMAIEIDPEELDYQYNKVIFLSVSKKLKEALSVSDQMIEKEPMNPFFLLQNGELLYVNKFYKRAIVIFEKYLSLTGNRQHSYAYISDCYSKLNNTEKCIHYNGLILVEDPTNVMALNNIGYNRMKLGKYKESIIDFDRAMELDKKFAYPYNNKGFACLKLGRLEEAHKLIKRSLELDSKNSYAYKNLGLYYIEIGYKQEAIKNLEIAQKLGFKELYGNEVNELLEKLK